MPDHPRVPHDARVEAGYPGPQLTGIRSTDVRMAIPGPAPVHVHVRDRQVPGLTLDAGTGRTELTRQGPRAPGSGRVSPPPRGSLRAGLRRPRGPAEAVPSSPPWRSASAFPICTCDRDEPGDRDHYFARGSRPAGGSREAPSSSSQPPVPRPSLSAASSPRDCRTNACTGLRAAPRRCHRPPARVDNRSLRQIAAFIEAVMAGNPSPSPPAAVLPAVELAARIRDAISATGASTDAPNLGTATSCGLGSVHRSASVSVAGITAPTEPAQGRNRHTAGIGSIFAPRAASRCFAAQYASA